MLRRPRRNRRSVAIRGLVQETQLGTGHLVYPLFVVDGSHTKETIRSLPGTYRMSLDKVLEEVQECLKYDLRNFILFPAVEEELKDKTASYSYHADNFYLKIATAIKNDFPKPV